MTLILKFNLNLIVLIIFSNWLFSQQPYPTEMIFNPRGNSFSVSGVGGGNIYELTAKNNSTSGQLSLGWNIALNDDYTKKARKEKLSTITTIFKYNPFLQNNYNAGDSIEPGKIAFIDNEFLMNLGIRITNLNQIGNDKSAKLLRAYFLDGCFTPYELKNSQNSHNTGFNNFNLTMGYQIGTLKNTEIGIVGIMLSPQINYIHINEYETNGTSFEELNQSVLELSNNLIGWGGKISVPINDFFFFLEGRKYIPIGNNNNVIGLTNRTMFTFGMVATGTVFTTKSK
jgi:hypothetical protein